MRLYEITRLENRDDATKILKKAGWKLAGEGGSANVYKHKDKQYVLKVFDHRDTAFIDFVKLCQETPNPHFPKYYKGIVKISPEVYAIRMEPLVKYKGKTGMVYALSNYADSIVGLGHKLEYENNIANNRMKLVKHFGDSIVDAIDIIIKMVMNNGGYMDIHGGNVMQRLDGTFVFSDPVVS